MSNSRPSITSPLRRTTTDWPAFTLLCTAPAATPPWNSTAATSFTGIWRSWPPTRSVNPTPPRSTSSPLCRSPLRITIVAFSCAVATPERTRLARATPQNIKVFLTIDSSCFLPTSRVQRQCHAFWYSGAWIAHGRVNCAARLRLRKTSREQFARLGPCAASDGAGAGRSGLRGGAGGANRRDGSRGGGGSARAQRRPELAAVCQRDPLRRPDALLRRGLRDPHRHVRVS